jgi:hypothetical protein
MEVATGFRVRFFLQCPDFIVVLWFRGQRRCHNVEMETPIRHELVEMQA